MPGARHLTVQWCFPLGLGWQERATSPCNGVVLLGPGCPGRATSSCNGVFRWVLDAPNGTTPYGTTHIGQPDWDNPNGMT